MPGVPAVAAPVGELRGRRPARSGRGRAPRSPHAVVDSGYVDVLDLSTGLRDDGEYAAWGTDRDTAQRAAWTEVRPPRLGQATCGCRPARRWPRWGLPRRRRAGRGPAADLGRHPAGARRPGGRRVDLAPAVPGRDRDAAGLGPAQQRVVARAARPPGRPIEAGHPLHAELDRARADAGPRPVWPRSSAPCSSPPGRGEYVVQPLATDRRDDGGIPPSAARRALDVLAATALLALLAAGAPGGRRRREAVRSRARALPAAAGRPGRPAVPAAQVPFDAGRLHRPGRHRRRRSRGSPGSARSCAAPAWTSSRSCGTCCAGTMTLVGPRPDTARPGRAVPGPTAGGCSTTAPGSPGRPSCTCATPPRSGPGSTTSRRTT